MVTTHHAVGVIIRSLPLVNAMTTSKTSKKTSIAGTQKSHRLSPKSNRRTTKPRNRTERQQLENGIQRELRHIHNLYLADKKHQETTLAAYKRAKDLLLTKMEHLGVKELKCDNTNFGVQLKERSHWNYSDATVRKEHELEAERKIEQDTGVATKDITVYISAVISR